MAFFVPQADVVASDLLIGAKARTLALVANECGHVPPFVALPTVQVEALWRTDEEERPVLLAAMVEELRFALPDVTSFAVRSAALNEDQDQSSQAGQFQTQLDVSFEDLPEAIWKVVQTGVIRLKGRAELFSCFIQVYQEADLAGVTFTRGPNADPRFCIEYHQGRGEDVVSGRVQPTSIKRFWGEETAFALPGLASADALLHVWKELEAYFEQPQDIEWCVVKGEWFLLQARPITTLTPQIYAGLLEADAVLPVQTSFLYEQTEITELAPHPSPLTLSLLERLYAVDGPIKRVYTSLGIAYDARDFFCIVSGQLYVDREEELKTLLPQFTLLHPDTPGVPHKTTWMASLQAFGVRRALASLQVPIPVQLGRLQEALQEPFVGTTIQAWSEAFRGIYETIFLTNLLTQQAFARLPLILDGAGFSVTTFLSSQCAARYRLSLQDIADGLDPSWQGNGLDIADRSPFRCQVQDQITPASNQIDRWWEALSSLSKTAYEPVLRTAVQMDQLREVGRWVTVRWLQLLRDLMDEQGAAHRIPEAERALVRLEEWEEDRIPLVEERKVRQATYEQSMEYRLPRRLTNMGIVEKTATIGLSAGCATGMVVTTEEISHHGSEQSLILWTEQLRPELAPLLPRVAGIMTGCGGLLSHLAILAREQGIPVISGVSLERLHVCIGDTVSMDGEQGTCERVSPD